MDETLVNAGKTLALFFLGAFVVDRLAKNLTLALALVPAWGKMFSGEAAEKAGKLVYFVVAAILGIGIAGAVEEMRILARLGAPVESGPLAALINGLVLMGGADVVQTLLGYLEDRREIRVPRSAEPVEIKIINQHEGPLELRSAGEVVGSRRGRTAGQSDEPSH